MPTARKLIVSLCGLALVAASCSGGGDKKVATKPTGTVFPGFGGSSVPNVATGGVITAPTAAPPSTVAGGTVSIPAPPTTVPGQTGGTGTSSSSGPIQDSGVTYLVQSGDSLNRIATRLGVSVQDLMALNGISNADVVQVGSRLKVPVGKASSGAAPKTTTTRSGTSGTSSGSSGNGATVTGEKVTVQSNDTLSKIAGRLGVPVADLQAVNPGVSSDSLQVGQKLNVPAKRSKSSSGTTTTTAP